MAGDERPWHRDPVAEYDGLGRKQPRVPGGAIQTFRSYPWILRHFNRVVPPEFFTLGEDDGVPIAVVACHCKVQPSPHVPFNTFVRCEGEDCRRWFWFTGKEIKVAREPEGYVHEADPWTAVVD